MQVRRLCTRKISHAKVCKQVWRPRRKVKTRCKSGRFIKGGELNRRKLCTEKFPVVIEQCSEGKKEQVNTMCEGSEHEVSWDNE